MEAIAAAAGITKRALDPDTLLVVVSAETVGWSRRQHQVMELPRRHEAAGAIRVDDIDPTY